MQLIHDGSKSCEYFCKGIDYVYDERIKKAGVKKQMPGDESSFLTSPNRMNKVCLVGTTEKDSLEWLKSYIDSLEGQKKTILLVLVDYFRDSMITHTYIKQSLLRGNTVIDLDEVVWVEFNEQDHITRIEDSYDHRYSYKRLSRNYKKKIDQVIGILEMNTHHKETTKGKQRGKAYANRSMV
jgi:hypothetical protein